MRIRNLTKKEVISPNAELCSSIPSKFIGLMFSKRQNRALLLKFSKERIISLHMLFVFYPIDVLFLDKGGIVVGKKECFKPFAFCKSMKQAMYAVELPQGTIKKTKTGIGDKIGFTKQKVGGG